MRFILAVVGFLLLMFGGTYWVLFTHSGNNIVRPYLEKEVSKKLQKDVILNSFTLKPDYIDVEATVDNTSKVVISGAINIIDKWFDVTYKIDAKNLKTPVVIIRDNLNMNGEAKGFLNDFSANGSGVAFKSKIRFATSIKKGKVTNLHVDAKGVHIEEMLELAKQPIYTKGVADVNIKGQESNGLMKGNADVKIHIGRLNEGLIKKDFNIVLPPNTTYKGNINALIDGNDITAKSDIFSTLARLKTTKSKIDIQNQSLNSDYDVLITKLEDWESILGKKLYGNLQVKGNIKKTKNTTAIDAHIQKFGGNIDAIVVDKQAEVTVKDVEIRDVLSMLGEPAIVYGKLEAKAKFDDIEKKIGTVTVNVKNGELIGEQLKNYTEVKFPQVTKFELENASNINNNMIDFVASMTSSLVNLPTVKGTYDLDNANLMSEYALHVKNMGKIDFLTKRKLKGELEATGEIIQNENGLKLTALSDMIDSNTSILFENNALHVNSNKVSFEKLSNMLDVPYVFDANGSILFDYNVRTKQGTFDINASNGRMVSNELVDVVLSLSGVDLRNEIYDDAYVKGNIDNTNVTYTSLLQSPESKLYVEEGTFDTLSQKIRAPFELKVGHRDFTGIVKGDIKKPKVNIKGSEYIKKKIEHEIDKHAPEKAKGLLKDILKLF